VYLPFKTKPGTQKAFKEALLKKAFNSSLEPGVARFDVLQDQQDDSKFVLIEIFKNETASAAHEETTHYMEWKETVADMMADQGQARKFDNLYPFTGTGTLPVWDHKDNFKFV
jgi:autoinducer 2-degrading protein